MFAILIGEMANASQVEILRRGTSAWNGWRKKHSRVKPDFSGEDFVEVSLKGASLRRANFQDCVFGQGHAYLGKGRGKRLFADFSRSDLAHSSFKTSKLEGARFNNADLSNSDLLAARLSGVDLTDARLDHCHLLGVQFNRVNLQGADLTEAHLGDCVFIATNLKGAKGLETCEHTGESVLDWRTLALSGPLPLIFLRGCGLPDNYIDSIPSLFWDRPFHAESCFISYSHADREFARRLHSFLEWRGVRCFRDEKQLQPGQDLYDAIDAGIRGQGKVLLCCSKHSLRSWWVDDEIAIALEEERKLANKGGRKILKIIPLDLDGYMFSDSWKSGYRAAIRRRLAADFKGWTADDEQFERAADKVYQALKFDIHTNSTTA